MFIVSRVIIGERMECYTIKKKGTNFTVQKVTIFFDSRKENPQEGAVIEVDGIHIDPDVIELLRDGKIVDTIPLLILE